MSRLNWSRRKPHEIEPYTVGSDGSTPRERKLKEKKARLVTCFGCGQPVNPAKRRKHNGVWYHVDCVPPPRQLQTRQERVPPETIAYLNAKLRRRGRL